MSELLAVALTRIEALLEQQNAKLARIVELLEPPAEPDVTECQHEPEKRIDWGGMGNDEEWECARAKGGCGFRYPDDLIKD